MPVYAERACVGLVREVASQMTSKRNFKSHESRRYPTLLQGGVGCSGERADVILKT